MVGLNIDNTTYGLIEYAGQESGQSDEEISYKFLDSVRKSLTSEDFDTKEFYGQVKYFLKLIAEDKLKIRKTLRPNHAKLYIFSLSEDQLAAGNYL